MKTNKVEGKEHQQQLYKVRFSDNPSMCYLVSQHNVLEVGAGVQTLLQIEETVGGSLEQKKRYQTRNMYSFEGTHSYEVGDFLVRIGRVRVGNAIDNSISVEVEYCPCSQPDASDGLLLEFFQNIVESPSGLSAAFHPRSSSHISQGGAQRTFALSPTLLPAPPRTASARFGSFKLPPYFSFSHLALQYVQNVRTLARASSASST